MLARRDMVEAEGWRKVGEKKGKVGEKKIKVVNKRERGR